MRQTVIHSFLSNYFNDSNYQICPLIGDASNRAYCRVVHNNLTYLLMDAPPDKESVSEFIQIGELFGNYIHTPAIFNKDIASGLLLLEDFGNTEFAQLIGQIDQGGSDDKLYYRAFVALKNLHQLSGELLNTQLRPYSAQDYEREMTLFSEWFLPFVGIQLSDDFNALQWHKFCAKLIDDILRAPIVAVHRDYHSRNLMVKQDGELGVIDFQDAKAGHYGYDVVSLLRDAYINKNDEWVAAQLKRYFLLMQNTELNNIGKNVVYQNYDAFLLDVNIIGVQRALKVLGIFVRLFERDGKSRYLANLPKVWVDLLTQMQYIAFNLPSNQSGEQSVQIYQTFYHYLLRIDGAVKQKFAAIGVMADAQISDN